ncbi:hypothetical protein PFLCHA0_c22150 [Pseudomonas protegens CHA0]|uniref:Uncharacterized protein n=1 Tax=Pseudomonas protegens (strain DSM 19095 / LMG 27888 / CFBP 6595 / CHA0) TaxID=1124983 RepID=A0A2C9EK02_PSEPH|nr:hypothetical protein PFLCHA0_c22150 [Pseudomonas protegens CHA0]
MPRTGCQEPEQGRCQLWKNRCKGPWQSGCCTRLQVSGSPAPETLHVRLHGALARP